MRARQADYDIIRHILRYCENIEGLLTRFGRALNVFKADSAYRDAISMNILQIGELTGHLSEEYRTETADRIPWRAIKSMRNLFAHSYGNMNIETIWLTATESIPELKAFCTEQLKLISAAEVPQETYCNDVDI